MSHSLNKVNNNNQHSTPNITKQLYMRLVLTFNYVKNLNHSVFSSLLPSWSYVYLPDFKY